MALRTRPSGYGGVLSPLNGSDAQSPTTIHPSNNNNAHLSTNDDATAIDSSAFHPPLPHQSISAQTRGGTSGNALSSGHHGYADQLNQISYQPPPHVFSERNSHIPMSNSQKEAKQRKGDGERKGVVASTDDKSSAHLTVVPLLQDNVKVFSPATDNDADKFSSPNRNAVNKRNKKALAGVGSNVSNVSTSGGSDYISSNTSPQQKERFENLRQRLDSNGINTANATATGGGVEHHKSDRHVRLADDNSCNEHPNSVITSPYGNEDEDDGYEAGQRHGSLPPIRPHDPFPSRRTVFQKDPLDEAQHHTALMPTVGAAAAASTTSNLYSERNTSSTQVIEDGGSHTTATAGGKGIRQQQRQRWGAFSSGHDALAPSGSSGVYNAFGDRLDNFNTITGGSDFTTRNLTSYLGNTVEIVPYTGLVIENSKNCSFEMQKMNLWKIKEGSRHTPLHADHNGPAFDPSSAAANNDGNDLTTTTAVSTSDVVFPLKSVVTLASATGIKPRHPLPTDPFLMPFPPQLLEKHVALDCNNGQTLAKARRLRNSAQAGRHGGRGNNGNVDEGYDIVGGGDHRLPSDISTTTTYDPDHSHSPKRKASASGGLMSRFKAAVHRTIARMDAGPASNRFSFYFPELAKGFLMVPNAEKGDGSLKRVASMAANAAKSTTISGIRDPDIWLAEFSCATLHDNKKHEGHVILTDRHLCFLGTSQRSGDSFLVRSVVPLEQILLIEECTDDTLTFTVNNDTANSANTSAGASKNPSFGANPAEHTTASAPLSRKASSVQNAADENTGGGLSRTRTAGNKSKEATIQPTYYHPIHRRSKDTIPKVLQIYLVDGSLLQLFDLNSKFFDKSPTQFYETSPTQYGANSKSSLSELQRFYYGRGGFCGQLDKKAKHSERHNTDSGVQNEQQQQHSVTAAGSRGTNVTRFEANAPSSPNIEATAGPRSEQELMSPLVQATMHQTFERRSTDLDRFEALLEHAWREQLQQVHSAGPL